MHGYRQRNNTWSYFGYLCFTELFAEQDNSNKKPLKNDRANKPSRADVPQPNAFRPYYLDNSGQKIEIKINTQKAEERCLQKQNDNGQLSSVFFTRSCAAEMPECANSYFAVFTVEYISFFCHPLMYAHNKYIFHHHSTSPLPPHLTNQAGRILFGR